MILGHTLSGNSFNDASFFNGDEPAGVLCQSCASCIDYSYSPASIDVKPSKKYDVSCTNDLRNIYSERFFVFCRDVLKADEVFRPLRAGDSVLYYMLPFQTIEFDYVRRKTRFEGACEQCGGYDAVAGAHPAFLKIHEPIGPGFFKTDLAFGSGSAKFPLIIVGSEWKKLLAAQKFRGIDFGDITA